MAASPANPFSDPIPGMGNAARSAEDASPSAPDPNDERTVVIGANQATAGAPRHFLQRIQLFSQLSPENCQQIVKRMKRRDFPPNNVVVRENAPGTSMFFITAGLVEVRKKDPVTGIDFLIAELGPGKNFGEMSLLTGKPRTATVTAIQPTTCAVLEQSDFRDALLQYPKIGLALTSILAERVAEATAHMGVDFINLSKLQIDPRALELIPQSMCMQHRILPVAFRNNHLTLAMTNPNNILAFDDVRRVVRGAMVEPVLITEDDLQKFMTTTYSELRKKEDDPFSADTVSGIVVAPEKGRPEVTADLLQSDITRELQMTEDDVSLSGDTKQELMNASEDAPIIRLTNAILGLAIKKGASDIHIEPQEKDVVVRFRIDGGLQTMQNLPKKVQLGLISRLKIVAKLDIAEKRMPQDGRISVSMEGKPIDFRVSTVPAKWGEKVCMRILDKTNTTLGLDKVITHPETLSLVRDLINQPYGIMYVTGPTGSGKTTTLYSALAELNDPTYNISTVEDPIEYDLPGINQIQVNKDIGLDFPRVLRAFLRQDPDIILIGETRDKETAHIAVEAALTGHMVFTTLHTNSAAGSFARLGEMSIEPFLVSSSTIGVMAQRLARRICLNCREQYEAEDHICEFMGIPPKSLLWKGYGCDKCNGKGVKGRIGIYEVMKMNAELRAMVARGALTEEVHGTAVKNGMLDLKKYAALLLLNGDTSVEEVLQVVGVQD
jgi:type IV pilus assembly protein PilB